MLNMNHGFSAFSSVAHWTVAHLEEAQTEAPLPFHIFCCGRRSQAHISGGQSPPGSQDSLSVLYGPLKSYPPRRLVPQIPPPLIPQGPRGPILPPITSLAPKSPVSPSGLSLCSCPSIGLPPPLSWRRLCGCGRGQGTGRMSPSSPDPRRGAPKF